MINQVRTNGEALDLEGEVGDLGEGLRADVVDERVGEQRAEDDDDDDDDDWDAHQVLDVRRLLLAARRREVLRSRIDRSIKSINQLNQIN